MSTNAPVESGLQAMRNEWVEEPTPGVPPADPEWHRYSAEVDEVSVSIDGGKEATQSLGSRDFVEMYRAAEEAELSVSYAQYEFPLASDGTIVDPVGYTMQLPTGDYPSLTHVSRRDVTGGGKTGAGYREYLVVLGARPASATLDGDPSAAEAIPQELTLPAETARAHIIHQPAGDGEVVVRSTAPADTNDVVIESEGASTTETVTLPGSDPNTAVTTETFGDIDAVFVNGEHDGDVMIGTDNGSGAIDTELLEAPLTGSNTDGVDSVEGVPPLGSGSHGSPPTGEGTTFLGTTASWTGSDVAPRVHTLDLSVDHDSSREPVQSSRRTAIDVGARTVEFDADLAGPYETAGKIKSHFRDVSGDLIYGFGAPGEDPANAPKQIVAHNVEIADAPDFTRSAGDTNYIPSVTFRAVGDPAIELINNS
jgi:hypothetical protein